MTFFKNSCLIFVNYRYYCYKNIIVIVLQRKFLLCKSTFFQSSMKYQLINKRHLFLFFLKKKRSDDLNQSLKNISTIKKMKTKYSSVILSSNKRYDEFLRLSTRNSLQNALFNILFKKNSTIEYAIKFQKQIHFIN